MTDRWGQSVPSKLTTKVGNGNQFQAVLTADMEGFSSRLKGDEETLITVVIRSYYRFSAEMAQQFEGDLFRREGDAIWCSFTSPLKALSAGIWLVEELHRFNFQRAEGEQIALRIGIHWGAFASESQALFGQTLTRARELENQGQEGCVNLSTELWDEVKLHSEVFELEQQLCLKRELESSRLVTITPSRRIEIEQLESERRQARWVIAIGGKGHAVQAARFSPHRGPYFAIEDDRSLIIVERRSRFQLSDLERFAGLSVAACRGPVEEKPSNDSIHQEFEGRAFDLALKLLDTLEPEPGQLVVDMTAPLPNACAPWGWIGGFPVGRRNSVPGEEKVTAPSYRLTALTSQGSKAQVVVDQSGRPVAATRELLASHPELEEAVQALRPWVALGQHPPERVVFSVGRAAAPQRLSLSGTPNPQACSAEILGRHALLSSTEELNAHLESDRLMLGCRRSLSEERLVVCLLPVGDSCDRLAALQQIEALGCRIYSFWKAGSEDGPSLVLPNPADPPIAGSAPRLQVACRWMAYAGGQKLLVDLSQHELDLLAVSRTLWVQVGEGEPENSRMIVEQWTRSLKLPGKSREAHFSNLQQLSEFCQKLQSGAQGIRFLSFPRRTRLRPPATAYKPLQYFGSDDGSIFFGREVELARLIRNIELHSQALARRGPSGATAATSLVFGRAGVGKTSFLRAGLLPNFRQPQHMAVMIRVQTEPLTALAQQLRKKLKVEQQPEYEKDLSIAAALERLLQVACARVPGTVLVVLDHFEELFLRCTQKQQDQCLRTLQELKSKCSPRVYWIIGIREDFLAELTEIQVFWPDILKDLHRLHGLRLEQARRSLVGPAERFDISWEQGLQDAVLNSLNPSDDQGIEPPLLQVVADLVVRHCGSSEQNPQNETERKLQQAFQGVGIKQLPASDRSASLEKRLSLESFQALGGTPVLMGLFLDKTIEVALGPQMVLTKRLLRALVSPSGQMISLSRQQLAREANLSSAAIRPLLSSLLDLRLLRSRQEGPAFLYELSTADFVPHILSWETPEEVAQRYASSLLKSEVQSARRFNAMIPQERLWLLGQHAPTLKLGSVEITSLVRSSALQGLDPQVWMQGEQGQAVGLETLLKLLTAQDTPNTRKREILAWTLRDFPEISDTGLNLLVQVAEQVANPGTLMQLARLGVAEEHQAKIRSAVRERFLGTERMSLVGAGSAWIGSTSQNKALRKSQLRPDLHPRIDSEVDFCQVEVSTFWIDRHLVTNAEYSEFRAGHVHLFPPEEANFPVVNVTYQQAVEYANWLGKQLPTEVQWEKAARGCQGQMFPWGNEFEVHRVNSAESGKRRLTAVDDYPEGVSPFGCLNMAGNVWEWTCSPWSQEDGDSLVAKKGGCAINFEPLVYCSSRFEEPPETSMRWAGFRCCQGQSPWTQNSGPGQADR